MSSETSDPGPEEVNEYEQQRIVRIAENKAKLQSLGLHAAVQSLSKTPRALGRRRIAASSKGIIKAGKTRQASLPRRSARIRQEDAPTPQLRHEFPADPSQGYFHAQHTFICCLIQSCFSLAVTV